MKAKTVCHSCLIDTADARLAKRPEGEFLVCNDTCKAFIESATDEQMNAILADTCRPITV